MTKINIEQICSITRRDKRENDDYEYKNPPSIKMWYDRSPNEGGFVTVFTLFRSEKKLLSAAEVIEKCNNNVYVENNKVYFKPSLSFRMSSQQYITKYFESVQELEFFLEEEVLKHIKVINI